MSPKTAWYWPSELQDSELSARYVLVELLAGDEAARLVVPRGWVGISPLPAPDAGQPEPHAIFVADPTDRDGAALFVGTLPRVPGSAVEVVTRVLATDGLTLVDYAERSPHDFEAVGRGPDHAVLVRAIARTDAWLLLMGSAPTRAFERERVGLYASICSLETFPDWASPLA